MPRIRTIKPKFWDDSKLKRISRDARLTYIGLWNFADDLGVIAADPVWLKSKIYPYDQIQLQQFTRWIAELSQLGFISLFSHEGEEFYYLPNLLKHQVINKPNYTDVCVPFTELRQLVSFKGTFPDESGINPAQRGKEGKGKEMEGSVGGAPPPTLQEVMEFFKEKNFPADVAKKAFEYHNEGGWGRDAGKPIKNWKQKMLTWMNHENKRTNERSNSTTRPTGSRLGPTSAAPATGGYGKL